MIRQSFVTFLIIRQSVYMYNGNNKEERTNE